MEKTLGLKKDYNKKPESNPTRWKAPALVEIERDVEGHPPTPTTSYEARDPGSPPGGHRLTRKSTFNEKLDEKGAFGFFQPI